MAMTLFTEAYKKARDVFRLQLFAKDWESYLMTDLRVGSLMGAKGLNPTHSASCDKLRKKIDDATGYWFNPFGDDEGDVIWDAAGSRGISGSQAERAGAIKFLRHLYRASKRGSQDVWVFNPPKAHKKFIFDELSGNSSGNKTKLSQKAEIYTSEELRWMCSSLSVALAAAQKAKKGVDNPSDETKQKIRDWFCDDHGSASQLSTATAKLKAGLPKIVSACNSNQLVFSDDPTSRKSRKKTYGLALRGGEGGGFPIIYLEGLFTKMTGNSGKIWLCAETIVHELTHTELSTEDVFYDNDGLKPTSNRFPQANALKNADSWGYFVMDMDGKISSGDKKRVLVEP